MKCLSTWGQRAGRSFDVADSRGDSALLTCFFLILTGSTVIEYTPVVGYSWLVVWWGGGWRRGETLLREA